MEKRWFGLKPTRMKDRLNPFIRIYLWKVNRILWKHING